jgi:hypothetical protein
MIGMFGASPPGYEQAPSTLRDSQLCSMLMVLEWVQVQPHATTIQMQRPICGRTKDSPRAMRAIPCLIGCSHKATTPTIPVVRTAGAAI